MEPKTVCCCAVVSNGQRCSKWTGRSVATLLAVVACLGGWRTFAAVERPVDLNVDGLVNPVVIRNHRPQLSWKLPWDWRGAAQSAYQVIAASVPERLNERGADLWDSGKVTSGDSVLVSYGGIPLGPSQTVWWSVRAWDNRGTVSDWSGAARFTTARPWPNTWSAKWVTYPDKAFADENRFRDMKRRVPGKPPYYPEAMRVSYGNFVERYIADIAVGIDARWIKPVPEEMKNAYTKDRLDENPPSPMFRKEFRLPAKVKRALLYSAGFGWQEIFLNGRRIDDGINNPAPTEYKDIGLYEAFDVTGLLELGENAVAVHVGGGWYQQGLSRNGSMIYGRPGLILELVCELWGGATVKIVSDESWSTTLAGPVVKDNFFAGCLYDARREMPGWDKPGFSSPAWLPVEVTKPLTSALEPAAFPPVRVTEVVRDDAMKEVVPGVWQMDANYVTGYVRLSGIRAPTGTEINVTYGDSLDSSDRVDVAGAGAVFYAGSHKVDRYICKGGVSETFEPKFVFRGFRYAEISGLPPGVKPHAEAVNLRTDVARNGEFVCSDPMFNDFQAMFVRTLETHMHGIISDNTTRERNQWLGDCMATRELYSWTFDMLPFWRKIVRDMQTSTESRRIAGREFPNLVRSTTANLRRSGFIPLWSMSVITVPWTAFVYYGDKALLEETYPWMKALMEACAADSPTGLMKTVPIGDWHEESADSPKNLQSRPPSTTPLELVGNGHYYDAARTMARIAAHLGYKEDEARYVVQAERIRQAVIHRYYDAARHSYGSQSGDAMALAFGIFPEGEAEALARSLAVHVEARDGHLNVGTLNGPLLVRALSETGRGDLLYEMFKKKTYPGFGFMRAMGSKTVWETWGDKTINPGVEKKGRIESSERPVSQQALASFGDTLFYRAAAGIHPDEAHPGFKHFVLNPDERFGANLGRVRASYTSPYGRIVSEWQRGDGQFVWTVTIPANSTATAHIPARAAESVMEGGQALTKVRGVKFLKAESGRVICEVQSGTYRFETGLSN